MLAKLKGERLLALRKAQKPWLTQEDIADLFGVDTKTVQRWESGQVSLPDEAIELLCKKFETAPAYFFDPSMQLTNTPPMSLSAAADVLRALEKVSLMRRQMALAILFDDSSLAPELPGLGDALKKLAQGLPVSKHG